MTYRASVPNIACVERMLEFLTFHQKCLSHFFFPVLNVAKQLTPTNSNSNSAPFSRSILTKLVPIVKTQKSIFDECGSVPTLSGRCCSCGFPPRPSVACAGRSSAPRRTSGSVCRGCEPRSSFGSSLSMQDEFLSVISLQSSTDWLNDLLMLSKELDSSFLRARCCVSLLTHSSSSLIIFCSFFLGWLISPNVSLSIPVF